MFVNPGLEMLKKNINFVMACPFRKVKVLIRLFPLNSESFQGFYEIKSFHYPTGLVLNLFSLNQTNRYIATVKNRFMKTMEDIFVYQYEFDVLEIDD